MRPVSVVVLLLWVGRSDSELWQADWWESDGEETTVSTAPPSYVVLDLDETCPDDGDHLLQGRANDHCYSLISTALTFSQARDRCRAISNNADLASLAKTTVLEDVSDWLSTRVGDEAVWIGAHDESRRDKFVWVRHSVRRPTKVSQGFMSKYWTNGGPQNPAYDCATFQAESVSVREVGCEESHAFLCHFLVKADAAMMQEVDKFDKEYMRLVRQYEPYDPLAINEAAGISNTLVPAGGDGSGMEGILEGDVLMVPGSEGGRKKRNAIAIRYGQNIWTDGIVPYIFDTTNPITPEQQKVVKNVMVDISAATCIQFVEHTTEEMYVSFQNAMPGCFSWVGMSTAGQPINLSDGCTLKMGTVVHEIMHALGFHHEQGRLDRDENVEIVWDNIADGFGGEFDMQMEYNIDHIGFCYEYGSVMHYAAAQFSKDRTSLLTIRTTNPVDSIIGQRESASAQDIQEINKLYNCTNHPISGGWTQWTAYGACSTTCGTGQQTRKRSCTCLTPALGGATCSGTDVETQDCMTEACPSSLSPYEWVGCWEDPDDGADLLLTLEGTTTILDGKYIDRTDKVEKCAKAADEVGATIFGLKADGKCFVQTSIQPADTYRSVGQSGECGSSGTGGLEALSVYSFEEAIDGEWGTWGLASRCTVSCGGGTATRIRECNNPAPSGGGSTCPGSAEVSEPCGTVECPEPIDGGWGSWRAWSDCSATCGEGYSHSRSRECNNPAPSGGGADCTGLGRETETCQLSPCPTVQIDGVWTAWSTWSDCGATCGEGYSHSRSRACNNPAPSGGGAGCSGLGSETETCQLGPCPVPINGAWTTWSTWSDCGATCGEGYSHSRSRACNNPAPSGGGADCSGLDRATETCQLSPCPVTRDGGWGLWQPWSDCGATCGTFLTHTRTRMCDNPAPSGGGLECTLTDRSQTESCGLDPCLARKVDGIWGTWGEWSACSVTCGDDGKTRFRIRSCNDPSPSNGGQQCPGSFMGTKSCHFEPCPVVLAPPADTGSLAYMLRRYWISRRLDEPYFPETDQSQYTVVVISIP